MEIKQINSAEEYNKAIDHIDQIFNAVSGSEDAEELNMLVPMVNQYESEHFPVEEPDPAEYRKIRQEETLPGR